MRIPMLAIHLNRDILSEGFKMNKQTHLVPVLASAVKKVANKPAANAENDGFVHGQSKRQKVDGAGDAADQLPTTAKVICSTPSALASIFYCAAVFCHISLPDVSASDQPSIPWSSRSSPSAASSATSLLSASSTIAANDT